MNHPRMYRDKEVVVLGLARSGVAAAKLFREYGARVIVNDRKERAQCPEADPLEALGISVVCGGHPDELIHPGVSLVVKNPGIPYTAAPVQRALKLGLEVVTEVEVAYHICRAPMIGITGSNGKTTTTTWIGNILKAAGLRPVVAGNIGTPLCEAASEAAADQWMVVELSSFQLKGTRMFRPRIACLLNVNESHMDYHHTMEDYIQSKANIFANQTADDIAVLNWDDPVCRQLAGKVRAHIVPFSSRQALPYGVCLEGEDRAADDARAFVVYRDRQGIAHPVVNVGEIGVPGAHNVENALAATAASVAAGVRPEVIGRALKEFRGVEHRLEFVADKRGVAYFNDSKSTNVAAAIKALESFRRPIVLIAGGQDRNVDFMELVPYFRERVKAIVTLGETRDKLIRAAKLAGLTRIRSVDNETSAAETLRKAVREASGFAESGDVVLLSPACASWDMFASYEERGRIFKESVHNL